MASAEQNESEHYRIIVLGRSGTEVLLVPDGERQMLPWVEIPRWQRAAENLTVAVKSDWGEEVICLFELPTESLDDRDITRYHTAEHLRTCGSPKMRTHWVLLSTLYEDSLTEAGEYAVIKQAVTACNQTIEGTSAGPFARFRWFCELRNWIESIIGPIGFHLTGEFQQLNASPSFSLMRFETNGPALWFKAVGEPNQREFAITCALARFFPGYLPKILSSRPDWNAWLTTEVQGTLLAEVREEALWEQAAVALARLQIQSIRHASQILGAGARDLGSAALSNLIQPFMTVVAQLMELQTKIAPPVLTGPDLLPLTDALQSSVAAIEASRIPETLGHLDLNPGNVIVSEKRAAFLDWAEAYCGNPLFSLEYLRQHARRALGAGSAIETQLTQAYCAEWDGIVSSTAMGDALAFAPLLAVFAYAAGNDAWKQPQQLQKPALAGYLRSLARRMHREAHQLADRRPLCLQ